VWKVFESRLDEVRKNLPASRNPDNDMIKNTTWLMLINQQINGRNWQTTHRPAVKIDFQKWAAVLLQHFKLISNEEKLIHKTKTYIDSIITSCL